MLKRTSGTRHLPRFENNAPLPLNVFMSNGNIGPNTAAPLVTPVAKSPVFHRERSPALAARSVRYRPRIAERHAFNVRNTEQPHHATHIGKQSIQPLKVSRKYRHRRNGRTRRARHSRRI
jgi:hypothetical protein